MIRVYYFISVVLLRHNVVTSETCFEKSKVLNDFINDISKSRRSGLLFQKN